jgi:ankyrin repeat protein
MYCCFNDSLAVNRAQTADREYSVIFTVLHPDTVDRYEEFSANLCRRVAPNRPPQDGRTPLHHAAKYGYTETVKMLIDRMADIEAESQVRRREACVARLWE